MRIVFMGTPAFAVPSLERLIADGYEVVGVFTQPDKPKNRGMKLAPSPVKACAQAHGLPVFQPVSFRKEPEALEVLNGLAPDLTVVAAYGQILPQPALDAAKLGSINVHSSLLPRYRGAAPINWAILNGEEETGVTIQKMALALDAGDVISQARTPIRPDETAEQLYDRLAVLGAQLLGETIPRLADGTAQFIPQDTALSSYAPRLGRELSPIDWNRPAREIHNQVRGLLPWPGASADLGGTRFKIFAVEETGVDTGAEPGTILAADERGILVACGDGKALRVVELQAPGKRRMKAADYLRGHPIL